MNALSTLTALILLSVSIGALATPKTATPLANATLTHGPSPSLSSIGEPTAISKPAVLETIPDIREAELIRFSETESALALQFSQPLKLSSFTLRLGQKQTATFNDQGIDGDLVAGDGFFSSRVSEPQAINSLFQAVQNKPLSQFSERARSEFTSTVELSTVTRPNSTTRKRANTSTVATIKVSQVPPPPDNVVDPDRELFVSSSSVLDDPERTFDPCDNTGTPMGEWTFGHLMSNIANEPVTGVSGSEFSRQWFKTLIEDQTFNGFAIGSSTLAQSVFDDWVERSGGPKYPLDMAAAPFRLHAIVNRIDLRGGYNSAENHSGEIRFIFGALSLSRCTQPEARWARNFSVIFEYKMLGNKLEDQRRWAQAWHQLSNFELESPEYRSLLAKLVQQVTSANSGLKENMNRSALGQLRTNIEISEGRLWELREFKLQELGFLSDGHLRMVGTALTPHNADGLLTGGFNHSDRLGRFVNEHQGAIMREQHSVPLHYEEKPFQSARSVSVLDSRPNGTFWNSSDDVPIAHPQARHLFSLNTCNACHARETNTPFVHVDPERQRGNPAELSGFLTGIEVIDPVDGSTLREFNELERRAQAMSALLTLPLELQVLFLTPAAPH